MRARGVVELEVADLVAELTAAGKMPPRSSLRPLLTQLSGGTRGGRGAPGAELLRLRYGHYRITGESGPLDAPRPEAVRGISLYRALRTWMEEHAASGRREFRLADAALGVRRYGMTSSHECIRNTIATYFMFVEPRGDVGRRVAGDATPTVRRVAHGVYKFVGQVPAQPETPPHVTALGNRILEVLTHNQANGKTQLTCREITSQLDVPASPQAIVRQLHRLHSSRAATIQFIGNNRCRTYVFSVTAQGDLAESAKCTRMGDGNRLPQTEAPSPSAA